MRPLFIVRLGLLLALLMAPLARVEAADTPAGGPLVQLKQSNERIDRLLKQKRTNVDPATRQEIKSIVNGFLDYGELARRSLAQHWDTLTAAQRQTFVKTLQELIEKNYVKQLRTNLDYTVTYKNEEVADDQATVATVVKVKTRGKSTDTQIDYKMKRAGDRWMVYDVITDEVSMVRNYKSQFHRIITQESFDALLQKMRTKIQETDETKPDSKPDGKSAGGVQGEARR